jgi:uncharacterized glyoxalase superfamily protein PhnB
MPNVTGVAAFFLVADVVRAAEYYRDKLGFRIVGYFFEEPPVFAMVGRDDQIIMLDRMVGGRGGSNRDYKDTALDAYLWTSDADALHAEFQRGGAQIVSPPRLQGYGMKEFEVRDLDGFVLCFAQNIAAAVASGA